MRICFASKIGAEDWRSETFGRTFAEWIVSSEREPGKRRKP
jgi:hypothetical protein